VKHRIVEHLKTSVDAPSWGPDWVARQAEAERRMAKAVKAAKDAGLQPPTDVPPMVLSKEDHADSQIIVRNLERSRQVAQYRPLYLAASILAVVIAALAMYVDYQIISGDVWTRALANEFMVVPDSLKDSVVFKSLQVVFAALAVHFMLKITGVYGRNTMITTAFAMTLLMVGCLGYIVAYNNMDAATSAHVMGSDDPIVPARHVSTIDSLFAALAPDEKSAQPAQPAMRAASVAPQDISLPLPKLSAQSLANAQGWFWLAFASGIFLIVTVVCALYMQVAEQNLRNYVIARDYETRKREYAQLHLLELSGRSE